MPFAAVYVSVCAVADGYDTAVTHSTDHTAMKSLSILLSAIGLLAIQAPSFAQSGGPYELGWFTIDGGGGTSSGGPYTLSGTIGQPDAGAALTGGPYSLIGGFWSIISAIQTPGAPKLSVSRHPVTGLVTVSWPTPADNWVLDQTSAMIAPPAAISWSQVGFPYQTNAGVISVTIPGPAGNKFYRLRKP